MSASNELLTEDRRREIFAALVAAQDQGMAVADSLRDIAARFGVSRREISQIEQEGMDNEWPPL